ncbi:hypothetical protein [Streptomyces montanisoli]|uniref:Uncharacterized protein n=1 Tax=Streptomyces montanisoli TaxID=2798581 RepID=A0A940M6N0_9ACTN|nr:hypothetical protein [Streptomyces montanisoli]MBP0457155.1 hypothetical protein [Streptomyces montanisoli]
MTEQSGTSTRLTGAVQDLAFEVVSALRSGDHVGGVCGGAGIGADDGLGLAAVRVLGCDVLLPSTMLGRPADAVDLALFQQAVSVFPPAQDAPAVSAWSHWAMTRTLLRLAGTTDAVSTYPRPGGPPAAEPGAAAADGAAPAGEVGATAAEPGTGWLDDAPWQTLTHQLAVLAALAVPGADSGVARVAARRPVDVARGFVRAVRRRDWLQAAGAGRWLSVAGGAPDTLGLDAGLTFVAQMGAPDARVALHVHVAQELRAGTTA